MTVTAVGAQDGILGAQVGANASGHRLLTDVGVAGAVDQTGCVRASQLLLTTADLDHLTEESEQHISTQASRSFSRRSAWHPSDVSFHERSSAHALTNQSEHRVLDKMLYTLEEARGRGAIDQAMIESETQWHHLANRDCFGRLVDDYRFGNDPSDSEDRTLG